MPEVSININVMAQKKPFILRLDEEMMKQLEKWASDEFRSINGQIEWILDQSLKKAGRRKKSLSNEKKS
ncbi:MAG: Arc-like DNA binding domain protein [Bacteroidetes bacterium ADurb.Bin234]|nr:MAG: Arc-like DNA binding domain protein [Bacteroidetes bacterium ADurb.Bin234]